ncbi:hypothetical protein [uncultured Shewanella sp.]|uniref:hypothetical protein n=1 Tax=uncultured Shewanella sp. TaxID=173975 RepID=UPI002620A525|nr:hypothetical protein [uncultured Shewanella sp.]
MPKFALFILCFMYLMPCVGGEKVVFVDSDGSFSPSSQENYNGTDPRVFIKSDMAMKVKMSSHSSMSSPSQKIKPKLTGIISFQLKPDVELEAFIQNYAIDIHWKSDFKVVDAKPSTSLNLTKLADIEYFFTLAEQLEASDDVLWVEIGRGDRRFLTK